MIEIAQYLMLYELRGGGKLDILDTRFEGEYMKNG